MQKIFYNGKIYTFDEADTICEAMLTNDGSIVLTSSNEEVLSMKTDETEVVDLCKKVVIPTFFDLNCNVYRMLEENLKNANLSDFLENNSEIDLNYDKFVNLEKYKTEFLKIQDEFLKRGITTIFEYGLTNKEFIFWKKLSEQDALKIDVIGFVDMISSKQVMDDNCRSYRKYKKHFRLGGYYLKCDGNLFEKTAWLIKPYARSKGYRAYGNLVDEQLSFLIKNALEEKKQIVFDASGDASISMVLRCFEENAKDKQIEDLFKPIILGADLISKAQIQKAKSLGFTILFKPHIIHEHGKKIKSFVGLLRAKKLQPAKLCNDMSLNFLLVSDESKISDVGWLIKLASSRLTERGKVLGKSQRIFVPIKNLIYKYSEIAFDSAFKGSLENGKLANFILLDGDNFDKSMDVKSTYIEGEVVYEKK